MDCAYLALPRVVPRNGAAGQHEEIFLESLPLDEKTRISESRCGSLIFKGSRGFLKLLHFQTGKS